MVGDDRGAEPLDHQRNTLAAPLRRSVARRAAQIWHLVHHLSPVPVWNEAGVWETVAVTLVEIMAGQRSLQHRQHHSLRPRLGSGRTREFIGALLAARGAGSPVSFTAWLMPRTTVRLPPDGRGSGRLQGI